VSRPELVDQEARTAIATELDSSVFVAAGAGTGKSTTLVDRIYNTVTAPTDALPIGQIAAITFTERAAGELRDRIRDKFFKAANSDPTNTAAREAMRDVDAAVIGTIHGFALSILREHALESGLPMGFAVVDESAAREARTQRWRRVVDAWLEHLPTEPQQTLALANLRLVDLEGLVTELDLNRARISSGAVSPPRLVNMEVARDRAVTDLRTLITEATAACQEDGDKLMVHLDTLVRNLCAALDAADGSELLAIRNDWDATWRKAFKPGNVGTAAAWGSREQAKSWRDQLKMLETPVRNCLSVPLENAIRTALATAWDELDTAAAERIKTGELEFDDLLLTTRALLETNNDVRTAVANRFRIVLVDEFQDTDPVQWDIVRLVTSNPTDALAQPEAGRLIVVGDPKQAIYSFRGADIRTYLRARDDFPGKQRELKTNFRSVEPLVDWVNQVFSQTMTASAFQSEYEPLASAHNPAADKAPGPPVLVLADEQLGDAITDDDEPAPDERPLSNALEPQLVASAIRQAVGEEWLITVPGSDKKTRVYSRPCRYEDIAILVPTRTGVPALLEALSDASVPFRSADASLVYSRVAVTGLIAATQFINEPDDELALWWALKSPLFGCTDLDLLQFRRSGGRWRLPSSTSLMPEGPVTEALRLLATLRSRWVAPQPVHVLTALVQECRLHQTLALIPRGGFDADCVLMVLAHAQTWQDDGGVGLGDYLRWAELAMSDKLRASLPEPDDRADDAVRLMTVHGAKGLEFPVVVLAGMASGRRVSKPTIGVALDGSLEFHTSDISSHGYTAWYEDVHAGREDAELLRLLYVACTRARDHLIVSIAGEVTAGSQVPRSDAIRGSVNATDAPRLTTPMEFGGRAVGVAATTMPALPNDWIPRIDIVKQNATRPWVQSPSGGGARALGVVSDTVNRPVLQAVDEPEEIDSGRANDFALRSRDGRPLGRAVHAALDQLFRGSRPPDDDEVQVACMRAVANEGIPTQLDSVHERVVAAIGSDVAAQAFGADHRWTELYLAAPVDHEGTRVVEGYADLVYDTDAGLVLVDYKTDTELTDDSVDHYRDQLGAYARLLELASGQLVAQQLILHLPGPIARAIQMTPTNDEDG
jgi:ATP-dependent exoDNAse (exonuclease V) beta subunit